MSLVKHHKNIAGFNTLAPATVKMFLKQLFHVTFIFRFVFSQTRRPYQIS